MKNIHYLIIGGLVVTGFGFYLYKRKSSNASSADGIDISSSSKSIVTIASAKGKSISKEQVSSELNKLFDSYTLLQRDVLGRMLKFYDGVAKDTSKLSSPDTFLKLTSAFEGLDKKYPKEQIESATKKVMADLDKIAKNN